MATHKILQQYSERDGPTETLYENKPMIIDFKLFKT